MRGGALPAALLCVALAFALAFAPRRPGWIALGLATVASGIAVTIAWPPGWHEGAFLAAWTGIIAMAASVHLPRGVPPMLAMGFGAATGLCAGAVIGYEGHAPDLARTLPFLIVIVPARAIVNRGFPIAIKVAASWLIAVAILAALLPLAPTPGYVPDHME